MQLDHSSSHSHSFVLDVPGSSLLDFSKGQNNRGLAPKQSAPLEDMAALCTFARTSPPGSGIQAFVHVE